MRPAPTRDTLPERAPVPENVRPFLKWAGGKRASVPNILATLPCALTALPSRQLDVYCEPFLGGGAVLLELARQGRFQQAIVSDANPELINCWKMVRSDPESVLRKMREWTPDKETYEAVRGAHLTDWPKADLAARTIWLNRYAFQGLFRVNQQGGFNVPMGKWKTLPSIDEDNIRAVSRLLINADVQFLPPQNYGFTINWVWNNVCGCTPPAKGGRRVLVYMDPPYYPEKGDSFTDYTVSPFGVHEQEVLARDTEAIAQNGWHVLLSNADLPEVRALYDGWTMQSLVVQRNISSKAATRGLAQELLIQSW